MNVPWIQVSIDTQDLESAATHIDHAVAIGAEWIEVGTPLLTFAGIDAIGVVANRVGQRTVVADFKALDGVGQYFERAGALGAGVATVMAVATEASIRRAVEVGRASGVQTQVDLLNVPIDAMERTVKEIAGIGADFFLIHLAIDELMRDQKADPLEGLQTAVDASPVPVGAVVFSDTQGVRAVGLGASYVVVGYPLITAPDASIRLSRFAEAVRGAA